MVGVSTSPSRCVDGTRSKLWLLSTLYQVDVLTALDPSCGCCLHFTNGLTTLVDVLTALVDVLTALYLVVLHMYIQINRC